MKAKTTVKVMCTVLLISALVGLGIQTHLSAADKSAVEDFVTRFYDLCLNRSPDPAGLNGWVSPLLDGSLTGSDVAYGFVFSSEFTEKNTTDEEYLQVLYEAFFNRQPDPAGRQGWLDALATGSSRQDVLNGFIFAKEFEELCDVYGIKAYEGHVTKEQRDAVEAFVTRFYQLCLGRDPDQPGLEGWSNNLLSKIQTGADVANGFVFSNEFTEKNTSNSDFLEILYEAFFDRSPDQGGWDVWLAALDEGRHRQEVLNGFIYSQEFTGLCQRFGIKGYDSVPPPVSSDNTQFYGSSLMTLKLSTCAEGTVIATIGDQFDKRFDNMYLYLPAAGSSFSYSGYDSNGDDYITKNVTVSGNTITVHEERTDSGGSKFVSDLTINVSSDYNSFTLNGYETDDDPGECQGAMTGSGYRLQFTGPYDGIWSGQADTSMPSCGGGEMVTMVIVNSQVTGSVINTDDDEYAIAGTVSADGTINGGIYEGAQLVANIAGKFSGNMGNGTYNASDGCQGTWTVTKQ